MAYVQSYKEKLFEISDPVIAMEYASFNGWHEELYKLIQSNRHDADQIIREWTSIYTLFYQRGIAQIKPADLLKNVQYKTSKTPPMFFAYRLLHAYSCYDMRDFSILQTLLNQLKESVQDLNNQELETFYRLRLSQLLANIYLRHNEVSGVREEVKKIISHCSVTRYVASAYHTLGLSYLYEDYDKGMEALHKAYKLYTEEDIKAEATRVQRSIMFFNNYYGIDSNYIIFSNLTQDIHERVHYEVRRGNKDKAREILSTLDLEGLSLIEKGYYFFYKGLVTDDIDCFYQSIEMFKKIEDKFAANMARIELYRRGERPAAIEAAYN